MRTVRCERGFGLMEVLAALSVVCIAGLALANAMLVNAANTRMSEERSGAVLAVQQVLDDLRSSDPQAMRTSGSDALQNVTIGPRTYAVQTTYCSPSTYCITQNIRFVHCQATLHGQIRYAVDTVFTQLK